MVLILAVRRYLQVQDYSTAVETTVGRRETPYNNKGDDFVLGVDGDNHQMYGGAGHDWVDGRGGNDVMYGGAGDDELYGGDGNDTMWGDGGADFIDTGFGNNTAYGGVGGDHIITMIASTAYGGVGNDYLESFEGATLFGGAGKDTLVASDGFSGLLDGGAGRDHYIVGPGVELVFDFGKKGDTADATNTFNGINWENGGIAMIEDYGDRTRLCGTDNDGTFLYTDLMGAAAAQVSAAIESGAITLPSAFIEHLG